MVEKLLDPLLKALESGSWGIAFLLVALAVIVKLRPIFEFLERQQSRREEFVKSALQVEAVAGAARSFLEEELNYLLLKKVTGISADRHLREKLKEIVDRSAGEIQTLQLAKAKSHLHLKDGTLSIVLHASDRFEWIFNWVFAVFMAFLAIALFMLPSTIKGITLQQLLSLMALGVVFFVFALFLVSQTISFSVAKNIAPIIAALESRQAATATSSVNGTSCSKPQSAPSSP